MIMSPNLRKFALTAHVTCSVGWFGAVAGFLALAIAGLSNQDTQLVRASYLAMGLMTWDVILPFCFTALLTGIISSLGTEWGLFRYYWVLVKLLLTIFATIVLLIHTQPINILAVAAAQATVFTTDLHRVQIQMVVAAAASLVVLIALTAISLYKPRGITPYGWRKQQERRVVTSRTLQG